MPFETFLCMIIPFQNYSLHRLKNGVNTSSIYIEKSRGKKRMTLVKWDIVSKPKLAGDLGTNELIFFNRALIVNVGGICCLCRMTRQGYLLLSVLVKMT